MKRRAVVLVIICIVGLCLHFSRLICATDAQILLYIAKEKGIESVDGLTLTDIIISDDKTMLWLFVSLDSLMFPEFSLGNST